MLLAVKFHYHKHYPQDYNYYNIVKGFQFSTDCRIKKTSDTDKAGAIIITFDQNEFLEIKLINLLLILFNFVVGTN